MLGPGFGFVLGAVTMFASALLTGGVGPWMPFQMLAMGWFTMGAGLLPGAGRLRGRARGGAARRVRGGRAFAYGTAMNLQGWTFMQGDGLGHRLCRAIRSPPTWPASSRTAWRPRSAGTSRARCVTVVLTLTLGGPILRALRRATRRAAFEAPVAFERS